MSRSGSRRAHRDADGRIFLSESGAAAAHALLERRELWSAWLEHRWRLELPDAREPNPADLRASLGDEMTDFAPFRIIEIGGVEIARSIPLLGAIVLANLALLAALWKELKVATFDPEFARTVGFSPRLLSRLVLVAVAVTAVVAFESVGAILVVTMLIVPAVAAYLLAQRLLA